MRLLAGRGQLQPFATDQGAERPSSEDSNVLSLYYIVTVQDKRIRCVRDMPRTEFLGSIALVSGSIIIMIHGVEGLKRYAKR